MALLSLYKVVVRSKPNYKVEQIYEAYENMVGLVVEGIIKQRADNFGSITITKLS